MESFGEREFWLIGEMGQFPSVGLPTFGDVLRKIFHHRFVESKAKEQCFVGVAKQLIVRWDDLQKTRVEQRDVVRRIKKLVELYDSVKKSKHRRTPVQQKYENRLLSSLDNVFDIAPKVNYHHKKPRDNIDDGLNFTPTERNGVEVVDDVEVVDNPNTLQDPIRMENLNFASTERNGVDAINKNVSRLDRQNEVVNCGLNFTPTERNGVEAVLEAVEVVNNPNTLQETIRMETLRFASTERNGVNAINKNVSRLDRQNEVVNSSGHHTIDDIEVDSKDDEDFETNLSAYYKSQFSNDSLINHNDFDDGDVIYKIINSTDVTSALDRTNTSTGSFVIILAAIARALDVDLTECVFSTSTLLRRREAHREIISATVKTEFLASIQSGLVVHWDGKRLKDSTNENNDERNGKVDRIAIVVTGLNIQKILAIAKTDDGTGIVVSDTVYETIDAWTILASVVAMCADTTAANTGIIKGACVLFEKSMKKNLIYLACRHHMLELIIGAVFILLFGETTGPNNDMFENFKRDWCQIDKSSFKPFNPLIFKKKYLKELRDDVTKYVANILRTKDKKFVPRGDYLEMMELCLLVLGESIPNYTFKLPHSCSNARWMGKIIYCFKMFLFRDQINFDDKQLADLEQFCLFACLIYTKSWIQCCIPSNAPINDLELLKSLNRYTRFNSKIAHCAIDKFQDHLWYLGSELVVLSLFSNKVQNKTKSLMFSKMKCLDNGQWVDRDRKLNFNKKIFNKELYDLVGPSSMTVLKSLQINIDFMFLNEVDSWELLPEYQSAKEIVDSLKVVNDTAERALKIMTDYNETLTLNEFKKQSVIQVVEDNRHRIPNLKKSLLASYTRRQ